ncbi:MAG TPA: hypothetical protein VL522_15525 [Bordetella sp.]|jgi:hypothetical protein|nr:hypothetical protein [Bordetella sp.]
MNELLKGLIGAELGLLGVPNKALPQSVASEPVRVLPHIDARAEALAAAVQKEHGQPREKAAVEFTQSHYRIAAG